MTKKRSIHFDDMIPLMLENLSQGRSVTFSPRGTSMLPMLQEGRDTVTLSALPARLKKYDLPLYRRQDGRYVLHRVVCVKDASYGCIGDHQFVIEDGVTHDQMIALVTSFTRNGRVYSVTAPQYKIYCRFWHYSRPVRHLWQRIKAKLKRLFATN